MKKFAKTLFYSLLTIGLVGAAVYSAKTFYGLYSTEEKAINVVVERVFFDYDEETFFAEVGEPSYLLFNNGGKFTFTHEVVTYVNFEYGVTTDPGSGNYGPYSYFNLNASSSSSVFTFLLDDVDHCLVTVDGVHVYNLYRQTSSPYDLYLSNSAIGGVEIFSSDNDNLKLFTLENRSIYASDVLEDSNNRQYVLDDDGLTRLYLHLV